MRYEIIRGLVQRENVEHTIRCTSQPKRGLMGLILIGSETFI